MALTLKYNYLIFFSNDVATMFAKCGGTFGVEQPHTRRVCVREIKVCTRVCVAYLSQIAQQHNTPYRLYCNPIPDMMHHAVVVVVWFLLVAIYYTHAHTHVRSP